MDLIIGNDTKKISLLDQNKIMFDMYFIADEFIFEFYSDDPIVISNNEDIYENLKNLMSNNYLFDDTGLSIKSENKLIWLSDQYGNLEDLNVTDKMSRLIIEKKEDEYVISAYKPFFEKNKIFKRPITIVFSSSGNGNFSKNMVTGATLQDDIINLLFLPYFYKKENKIFVKNKIK